MQSIQESSRCISDKNSIIRRASYVSIRQETRKRLFVNIVRLVVVKEVPEETAILITVLVKAVFDV